MRDTFWSTFGLGVIFRASPVLLLTHQLRQLPPVDLPLHKIINYFRKAWSVNSQPLLVHKTTCWQRRHISPSTSQQGTENLCIYRLFYRKNLPASSGNVDFTFRAFERRSFVTAEHVDQIYTACFCMLKLGSMWAVFSVRVTEDRNCLW